MKLGFMHSVMVNKRLPPADTSARFKQERYRENNLYGIVLLVIFISIFFVLEENKTARII